MQVLLVHHSPAVDVPHDLDGGLLAEGVVFRVVAFGDQLHERGAKVADLPTDDIVLDPVLHGVPQGRATIEDVLFVQVLRVLRRRKVLVPWANLDRRDV